MTVCWTSHRRELLRRRAQGHPPEGQPIRLAFRILYRSSSQAVSPPCISPLVQQQAPGSEGLVRFRSAPGPREPLVKRGKSARSPAHNGRARVMWVTIGSGRRWDQALEALLPGGASALETIAVRCPARAGRGGRLIVPGGDQEVTPR